MWIVPLSPAKFIRSTTNRCLLAQLAGVNCCMHNDRILAFQISLLVGCVAKCPGNDWKKKSRCLQVMDPSLDLSTTWNATQVSLLQKAFWLCPPMFQFSLKRKLRETRAISLLLASHLSMLSPLALSSFGLVAPEETRMDRSRIFPVWRYTVAVSQIHAALGNVVFPWIPNRVNSTGKTTGIGQTPPLVPSVRWVLQTLYSKLCMDDVQSYRSIAHSDLEVHLQLLTNFNATQKLEPRD